VVLLLHESVEVPEPPVTLVGERVHERLVEFVATVRLTVAEKPWSGATVRVEVPATPTVVLTVVGLAVSVKSCTVTVTVAVWVNDPLVPVTVTV
jgi:hypothetical protein